jgi:hypothetical protein
VWGGWNGAAASCRKVQIKCNKWPNFYIHNFRWGVHCVYLPWGPNIIAMLLIICVLNVTSFKVLSFWFTYLSLYLSLSLSLLLSPMSLIMGFTWNMQFFRFSRTSIFQSELPKSLDHMDYTNLEYMIPHFITYVVWYTNCIIKCYVQIYSLVLKYQCAQQQKSRMMIQYKLPSCIHFPYVLNMSHAPSF